MEHRRLAEPAKRGGPSNLAARYPRLLAHKQGKHAAPPFDPTGIVLGMTPTGTPVVLPERPRREHLHAIGATGSGKTNFLAHSIRQDIEHGWGVCVVDPHGSHRDSLYRSLVVWLHDNRRKHWLQNRTIHLIDPNAPTHTVGFNPLEVPDEETDLSVVAGTTLDAFARVWGDEDTHQKPRIRKILKATFAALAERGLTLSEAELLFDPHDARGIRAFVLAGIKDKYARAVLAELHQTALDEKSKREFRAQIEGPINRIAEFVSAAAIRNIIGQRERTLDMRAALDEGHVILVNLSGGTRVYEADAELLGRLLTRFLFFHAKRRRRPEQPFWFYLDECQRYLSGDVPELLGEARKYGVGVVLSHQWLGQLQDAGENMLAAVLNGPNLKAVFRPKDPKEAEMLAETVMPFDLERPVKALVKPTVVGQRLRTFRSWGTAEHDATSTAIAEAESEGVARGTSESSADSRSDTESYSTAETANASLATGAAVMHVSGSASGTGSSNVSTMTPVTGWLDAPIPIADAEGESSSASSSTGTGSSSSSQSSVSSGKSRSNSTGRTSGRSAGRGSSHSETHSTSTTVISGRMLGSSRSEGGSEGWESIYRDLPGGVHSLENVRYMAAQELRQLKTGEAYISYVGMEGWRGMKLLVPRVNARTVSDDDFVRMRSELLNASPSALPIDEAQAVLDARERNLMDAARVRQPVSEPEHPQEFRVRPLKATGSRPSHGQPSSPRSETGQGCQPPEATAH